MTAYFADTSYFLSLLIAADANHVAARQWSETNRHPLVTTEYVLIEIGNFLSDSRTRHLFAGLLKGIHGNPRIQVLADLFNRGARLYLDRGDKSWSLTDCISFVVMHDQGLTEALTGDRHFEQAGFVAVLRNLQVQ